MEHSYLSNFSYLFIPFTTENPDDCSTFLRISRRKVVGSQSKQITAISTVMLPSESQTSRTLSIVNFSWIHNLPKSKDCFWKQSSIVPLPNPIKVK